MVPQQKHQNHVFEVELKYKILFKRTCFCLDNIFLAIKERYQHKWPFEKNNGSL